MEVNSSSRRRRFEGERGGAVGVTGQRRKTGGKVWCKKWGGRGGEARVATQTEVLQWRLDRRRGGVGASNTPHCVGHIKPKTQNNSRAAVQKDCEVRHTDCYCFPKFSFTLEFETVWRGK